MTRRTDYAWPTAGVDLADLLERAPTAGHERKIDQFIAGKRVLVTGAGGSIGSEIVRQLHDLDPEAVYQLDHDESTLHALQLQLHGHGLFNDDHVVLADVRDEAAMASIMCDVRPDVVYHAAALKHLPLLERYPLEAIKTNVLGTANVLAAAALSGVTHFINVSTDKAARPSSVLGATKRFAETIVAAQSGGSMRVASVRFGNVLGSRGSLLDSLAFQLAHGQPITVTDPAATRFFMTIPEAAGLVLESSTMFLRGETFVLDMGLPLRILDLVNRYAALCGQEEPLVQITGLRPGEKLHEELYDGAEVRLATADPRISAIQPRHDPRIDLSRQLTNIERLTAAGRAADARAALWHGLPDDAYCGERRVSGHAWPMQERRPHHASDTTQAITVDRVHWSAEPAKSIALS